MSFGDDFRQHSPNFGIAEDEDVIAVVTDDKPEPEMHVTTAGSAVGFYKQ